MPIGTVTSLSRGLSWVRDDNTAHPAASYTNHTRTRHSARSSRLDSVQAVRLWDAEGGLKKQKSYEKKERLQSPEQQHQQHIWEARCSLICIVKEGTEHHDPTAPLLQPQRLQAQGQPRPTSPQSSVPRWRRKEMEASSFGMKGKRTLHQELHGDKGSISYVPTTTFCNAVL